MRLEYLISGVDYLSEHSHSKIDKSLLLKTGKKFEKALLSYFPEQARAISQNRFDFLSSKKEIKFR